MNENFKNLVVISDDGDEKDLKLFRILGGVPTYEKWLILNELLKCYCVATNEEELVAARKTRSGTGTSSKMAQPTSKVVYFYHLFSVLLENDVNFALGDFTNVKGSFYIIENEIVKEFGKDNLEYGRRPTKPTFSFEEVNNRLRNCGNINPFSNFSDLQCVVLTQLGLFCLIR